MVRMNASCLMVPITFHSAVPVLSSVCSFLSVLFFSSWLLPAYSATWLMLATWLHACYVANGWYQC